MTINTEAEQQDSPVLIVLHVFLEGPPYGRPQTTDT